MKHMNFNNTRVPVKHGPAPIQLDRSLEAKAQCLGNMQVKNPHVDATGPAEAFYTLVKQSVCASFKPWVDKNQPNFKHTVCKSGENGSRLLAGRQCLGCTLMNADNIRRPQYVQIEGQLLLPAEIRALKSQVA